MRMKTLGCLVVAALVHTVSHASVMYSWRPLNDKLPQGIDLRLEFDDAAVAAGAFSLHVAPTYMSGPGQTLPNAGLLSLFYTFQYGPGISYLPREETFRDGLGQLDMDVTFDKGGFLSGYISANDQEDNFAMFSHGRVFRITDARSDAGMPGAGCDFSNQAGCNGATGLIHAVPEPASLPLLAIGVLGAAGAVRRRRP